MWRISALDRDGREIGRFELEAGEVTIGREVDRQLVLQSASVSRRHARIVVENGRASIVDEGSSNGVLVNGMRITAPTAVGPSTRIDIAEFRIALESLSAPSGAVPMPPMGMPAAQPMGGAPVAPAFPATAAVADLGVRLVAEGGPFDGRVFNVRPGTQSVGRAVDNDLVFEDPSLSRKHARVHREGDQLEVEDLGSSNGTFVNGRKITRAPVVAGDVLRFGDLNFRVEGGAPGSTRSVEPGLPRPLLYALFGGAGLTGLLILLAIIFLIRKVPSVQAPGKDAIAKIARQAEQHLDRGRTLHKDRKYTEAKIELDQAIDLDPANVEARKLRVLAMHGADDDRAYTSASAALTAGMASGDRRVLESVVQNWSDMTEGSAPRMQLASKLGPRLARYGVDKCQQKKWADCAWGICRSYEISPTDARPDAAAARALHDAEKKLAKDRTYVRCKAAD